MSVCLSVSVTTLVVTWTLLYQTATLILAQLTIMRPAGSPRALALDIIKKIKKAGFVLRNLCSEVIV